MSFARALLVSCLFSLGAFAGTADFSPSRRVFTNDWQLTDPPTMVRDSNGDWAPPVLVYGDGASITAWAPRTDIKRIVFARPKEQYSRSRYKMLVYFQYAAGPIQLQAAKEIGLKSPEAFGFMERVAIVDNSARTWTDVDEKFLDIHGKTISTNGTRLLFDMEDSRNKMLSGSASGLLKMILAFRVDLIRIFGPYPFLP